MNEPTLKEIETVADAGISGVEPSVVYDNTATLNLINQNAQFKANNDWRKYQQFLGDYENRLKSIQDLSNKEVAEADRPYLKQKAVDLLSGALDSPTAIYSTEFNQKLSNLTQDATSSKLKNDFDKAHRLFLTQHPEWMTDQNKATVQDLIQNQTLDKGQWKPYMLEPPADVLDRQKYFTDLSTAASTPNAYAFIDETGHQVEGTNRTYDFKRYKELMETGYADPRIKKIAKQDYEALDPQTKAKFDDAKDYWVNYGSLHWKDKGFNNYTVSEKKTIQADPGRLDREKLALEWYKAKTDRQEAQAKNNPTAAATVVATEQPFESIFEAWGGKPNTLKKLANLPIAQIVAIAPDALDKEGEIKDEYKNAEVSFGISLVPEKNPDGSGAVSNKVAEGIHIYQDGWDKADYDNSGKTKASRFINKELVDAQGQSYITGTGVKGAKELKGQLVYGVKGKATTPTVQPKAASSNVMSDAEYKAWLKSKGF